MGRVLCTSSNLQCNCEITKPNNGEMGILERGKVGRTLSEECVGVVKKLLGFQWADGTLTVLGHTNTIFTHHLFFV